MQLFFCWWPDFDGLFAFSGCTSFPFNVYFLLILQCVWLFKNFYEANKHSSLLSNAEMQCSPWIAIWGYEIWRPLPRIDDSWRRDAYNLNNAGDLVCFILATKQWPAGQQLRNDTSKTPHVNGDAIAGAEDDLRSTVKSGLDVCVDALVVVTARSKVNHLRWTCINNF